MEKMIKLNTYDDAVVVVAEKALEQYLTDNGIEETVEEFVNETYTYDDADEIFCYCYKDSYKVLGYFIHKQDLIDNRIDGVTVFVAIDQGYSGSMGYYSPIGQHSEGEPDYLKECVKISKEEYLKAAGPNGTPAEYL